MWQWARTSWIEPNLAGKAGRYFNVLNWASENGLSLETWGRLWALVIPRSASRNATDFEVIAAPRSAWIVSYPRSILLVAIVDGNAHPNPAKTAKTTGKV